MFDWTRFLDRHGIGYVSESRSDIAVHCPFCASDDPSFHLSISLTGAGWNCWRNPKHRGRAKWRLVQGLLRCSGDRARELAGETGRGDDLNAPPNSSDGERLVALLRPEAARVPTHLDMPRDFRPLDNGSPLAQPFRVYLERRGYDPEAIDWLAVNYDLRYATVGAFAYRIIIPIYDRYHRLITWTGRAIRSNVRPRYKTLSADAGALAPPGSTLLGYKMINDAVKPHTLVICEGPFDAMRVSVLGRDCGVYGTCLFGLNAFPEQRNLLTRIAWRFDRVVVCLDNDSGLLAERIAALLRPVKCRVVSLPPGVKDPGELNGPIAADFVHWLANPRSTTWKPQSVSTTTPVATARI